MRLIRVLALVAVAVAGCNQSPSSFDQEATAALAGIDQALKVVSARDGTVVIEGLRDDRNLTRVCAQVTQMPRFKDSKTVNIVWLKDDAPLVFRCNGPNVAASPGTLNQSLCPTFFLSKDVRISACEETDNNSSWVVKVQGPSITEAHLVTVCQSLNGVIGATGANAVFEATSDDGAAASIRCQIDHVPFVSGRIVDKDPREGRSR